VVARGARGRAAGANDISITCDAAVDDNDEGEVGQSGRAVATHVVAVARRSQAMKGIHTAFIGRLGRPPELRTSKSGKPYATFSVVVAIGPEDAQWLQVVAFGETAEALAGLPSGTSIYIEGHLRVETFEKRDGASATVLKVTASVALPLGQIGNKRRSAPVKKSSKKLDSQAPLGTSGHGGPEDPIGF